MSPLRPSRDIEPTPHWLALLEELAGGGSTLVAFSGGVDSTLLAKAAVDVLGEAAVAVTAVSPSLPDAERREAVALAREIGITHHEIETREAEDPRYVVNASDRCYFCKEHLFEGLGELRARLGDELKDARLIYGANVDDLGDFRPGMEAARQAGVGAPLLSAGLDKEEIREASRRLGLPTWDKPALACLASRLPHGRAVTTEALARVEAAESAMRRLGFRQLRVRHHGDLARLEVERADLPLARSLAPQIVSALQAVGFERVEIDPRGYRAGSLNEPHAGAGD